MARGLHLAAGLTLSLDYVTKTAAVLAQRRKGKTYTASVIAEELVRAKLPFVALDPTGAWWGLRASADGKSAGLPVVVIGGQHGDLPLERGAGRFVADLVLDHPGYYVLDLSLLGSRAAEREFATAFADRLYRRKMQPGMDFPLHLFVDEADLFVPQEREGAGDVAMLGAFQAIVRRGGLHGLGTTLISQRPALVNKSVLTQLDLLIILRLVAGNDQDAVDKNYVSRSGTKEQKLELMGSLASLKLGEAWVYEPGGDPALFERVQIRERHTFNSSATPKPGEQRIEPKVLADVDLESLRERMAETLEREKLNDPVELHKRLHDMQRRLAEAEDAAVRVEWADGEHYFRAHGWLPPEEQPQPLSLNGDLDRVRDGVALLEGLATGLAATAEHLAQAVTPVREGAEAIAGAIESAAKDRPASPPRLRTTSRREPERPWVQPQAERAAPGAVAESDATGRAASLPKPEQRVIDALAWWEAFGITPTTRVQAGVVARYSSTSGGFKNLLGKLRNQYGLITYPSEGTIALTDEGRALAVAPQLPRTNEALQEAFLVQIKPAQARVLDAVLRAYPRALTREEIGEQTGYSPDSGGFKNLLGSLRSFSVIDYPEPGKVVATDVLFPAG
jgi:hypothetical protein